MNAALLKFLQKIGAGGKEAIQAGGARIDDIAGAVKAGRGGAMGPKEPLADIAKRKLGKDDAIAAGTIGASGLAGGLGAFMLEEEDDPIKKLLEYIGMTD